VAVCGHGERLERSRPPRERQVNHARVRNPNWGDEGGILERLRRGTTHRTRGEVIGVAGSP
jgi:hypothetical protein